MWAQRGRRFFVSEFVGDSFGFSYLALRSNGTVLLVTLFLIPVLFALTAFAESLGPVRMNTYVADMLIDQRLRSVIEDLWIPIMNAAVLLCGIGAPRRMPSLREWRTLPFNANQLCIRILVLVSGMLAILVLLPSFAVLLSSGIDSAVRLFLGCLGAAGLGLVAVPLLLIIGARMYYAMWAITGLLVGVLWSPHGELSKIWQTFGPVMGAGGLFLAWILLRSVVMESSRAYRHAEPN